MLLSLYHTTFMLHIYTTIKTVRLSVIRKWAWLAGRGRCTESRPGLETVN